MKLESGAKMWDLQVIHLTVKVLMRHHITIINLDSNISDLTLVKVGQS